MLTKLSFLVLAHRGSVKQLKMFFPITLLNQHVMQAVSTRNLGVILDDKRNFTA